MQDYAGDYVDVSVSIQGHAPGQSVILVTSLHSGNKQVAWRGTPVQKYHNNTSGKPLTAVHAFKIKPKYLNFRNGTLKCYIWNKNKQALYLDDFRLRIRKGNPLMYGLYQPF